MTAVEILASISAVTAVEILASTSAVTAVETLASISAVTAFEILASTSAVLAEQCSAVQVRALHCIWGVTMDVRHSLKPVPSPRYSRI